MLFEPLHLPNGTSIPNRVAKAAMEENMADAQHLPSDELLKLYKAWAVGGVGLMLTGNVMVSPTAMTGPGGVVLDSDAHLPRFKVWADTAKAGGAKIWMQINHPGRQMQLNLGQPTLAPSAVALDMGKFSKRFWVPKAMSADDIADIQRRFVNTAKLAEAAGFDGVQVHAAHGYLLSQFLSPISNHRDDEWGGSLENRSRLLLNIVREIRTVVRPGFAVAVKLNSADFQRGGFSEQDAAEVVKMLNDMKVDLIELSGGSYEAPAMQGQSRDGRTLAREAYFLEFAREIAKVATVPLMVTGGIRRLAVAQEVLNSGIDMVGMGTALAINPNLPNAWKRGEDPVPEMRPITWNNKTLASLGVMAMVKYQLRRMSKGLLPNPQVNPAWALALQQFLTNRQTGKYRKWANQQSVRK
ncbi:NADH:flavin oxidoreductase/NADH oxidase family protein [Limnobacter litoralis]|uniref:2,4-dienoyl-CoA reductase n=1 Tax=Limnobacter litoralis TaxID=481366 RepID=A0ABQ5YUE5_9BURK|nr:NADH:flavin oxidoreductase/NADH oxidase family protein [Limnobacter litoralis]GLR26921.1 2,4-dienoyl-CoA reductase [Limnobacter litoralis]